VERELAAVRSRRLDDDQAFARQQRALARVRALRALLNRE